MFTVACVLSYGLLGWTLSGLGAVLPQLRDALGGIASVYPSLPGAALIIIGIVALVHHRSAGAPHRSAGAPHRSAGAPHQSVVRWASVGLAVALALVVVTDVPVASAIGAVLMATMAALLISLLPAALTSRHPERSAAVMTTANGWSSLAGIAAPLAVGAAVALGLGWRVGFVVPPVVATLVVIALTSHRAHDPPRVLAVTRASAPARGAPSDLQLPWFDAWLVLTLSILVEFAFAFFATTYLREEVGMTNAGAAAGAASFAIGMASARFLAGGVPSLRDHSVRGQLVVVAAGFSLLWFLPSPVPAIAGFVIAGFGIALLYPTGIGRLMRRFPGSTERGASRGALASGVALLGAPALLGTIRALSNVRVAFISIPVLLGALAATYRWSERRVPPP